MNTTQQQNTNNGTSKTVAPVPQPMPTVNAPNDAGNAATTEPKAPVEKRIPERASGDATRKQTPPPSAKNAVEPPLQAANGNDKVMSQEQKKS